MTGIEVTNLALSISGFFVAAASFFVSWLAFSRDAGRLDVSVSLGHIYSGPENLTQKERIVSIQVVNSGRRPVLLGSFGGDAKYNGIKKVSKFFRLPWEPRSWVLMGSQLVDVHFRPGGRARVLQEGESLTVPLPYTDSKKLVQQMTKSACLYVFDSTSKKYRVKRRSLSKLRKDFADWEAGKE